MPKIQGKKILILGLLTIPISYIEHYHLWIIYFLNPCLTSAMFAVPMIFNVVFIGLIGFNTLDLKFEGLFLFISLTLLTTDIWALLLMIGGIELFWVWPSFIISYVVAGIFGLIFMKMKHT